MSDKMNAVKELKSERVQEEMMAADEPLIICLKSERVQEPESLVPEVTSSSTYELMVNPCERVTIGLQELQVTITLEGLKIGPNQAARVGEAG
jgi:hypothetical protein